MYVSVQLYSIFLYFPPFCCPLDLMAVFWRQRGVFGYWNVWSEGGCQLPSWNTVLWFLRTAWSACRCSADVWKRPWLPPYCCSLFKGICVGISVSTETEESLGAREGYAFSLAFITQGGCLSRIGCRRRGSKLIIQHAVNVSKASVGKLQRSKGLFQQTLLNIPKRM